ncbi:FAD-dependent monooxygenase fmqB [Aspergillus mulundensis]|uniref:Putative FAD dependent oxidoreductase n=1 Tax=Aspergillus mulundensis TaxID=1810919 RepID=A0A3D8T3E2_9EURO|nr:putative FAD dependent oxidoreductase [Aspergillus mulundensis]RDW92971.1 putative FAD dependent oxidoreductase [Aspergillus mulundensis]
MAMADTTPTPTPTTTPTPLVIVVGLGLAGLTTAIECHRRGINVLVLEKVTELKHDANPPAGDGIFMPPNAARVISRWDTQVQTEIAANKNDSTHADFFDDADAFIVRNEVPGKGRGFLTNRGKLVLILYAYALRLGIQIRLGTRVAEYWEDEASQHAGVLLDTGERVSGDCVICADGVHGKARAYVTGSTTTRGAETNLGFATFRAHLRTDTPSFIADPEAQWIVRDSETQDRTYMWFGAGVNLSMMTLKHGREIVWMTTHRDTYAATETEAWAGGPASHAHLADVFDCISHWPGRARIESIVRHTDPAKLVNHPLVYRAPLKTWRSGGGRVMLIGDAAHPYYPVVGQGGAQGVEDGAVVAVALARAGRDVRLALEVAERIRYPRASVIQLGSREFQASVLEPDWEAVRRDPGMFRLPNPEWIFEHDCVAFAEAEYEAVVECAREGVQYVPKNIPDDGVYRVEDTYGGER